MRVYSTIEVNNNKQHNPYLSQNVAQVSNGKSASGLSFQEHLMSNFQKMSSSTVTSQTESLVAGFFLGCLPSLRVPSKPEPTLEDSAS